jgi:ribosomal protein L7/L12
MEITPEKLSSFLKVIDYSSNDRDHDIGWNNAVISIMNVMGEDDIKSIIRMNLPSTLEETQISEILIDLAEGNNLLALKKAKDWLGTGLKETKEMLDTFKDTIGIEKIKIVAAELKKFQFKTVKS